MKPANSEIPPGMRAVYPDAWRDKIKRPMEVTCRYCHQRVTSVVKKEPSAGHMALLAFMGCMLLSLACVVCHLFIIPMGMGVCQKRIKHFCPNCKKLMVIYALD